MKMTWLHDKPTNTYHAGDLDIHAEVWQLPGARWTWEVKTPGITIQVKGSLETVEEAQLCAEVALQRWFDGVTLMQEVDRLRQLSVTLVKQKTEEKVLVRQVEIKYAVLQEEYDAIAGILCPSCTCRAAAAIVKEDGKT